MDASATKETYGADYVYFAPGIAFETVDAAFSWFLGLDSHMNDVATFISRSLENRYDGDWMDSDGSANIPSRWYRDVVDVYRRE